MAPDLNIQGHKEKHEAKEQPNFKLHSIYIVQIDIAPIFFVILKNIKSCHLTHVHERCYACRGEIYVKKSFFSNGGMKHNLQFLCTVCKRNRPRCISVSGNFPLISILSNRDTSFSTRDKVAVHYAISSVSTVYHIIIS